MSKSFVAPLANVLGIPVHALTMETALAHTRRLLTEGTRGYICAAAVHGIVEAGNDPALRAAYNEASLVIPDGMPLVWVGRRQGHTHMERVTGPDLMWQIFCCNEFAHVRHFLYGGDPGVAEELRARLLAAFPSAHIVGTYTPPFRELNAEEERELELTFNTLRPDVLWIGLGCPKQELFMARYHRRWNAKLMIGVGAAFNFHTGRIRDCAPWVKLAGLQWLHRLVQDPRRLWKRYLRTNSVFVCRLALQTFGVSTVRPCTPVHAPVPQRTEPAGAKVRGGHSGDIRLTHP